MISEGPSARDGEMLYDFDAHQPVDPLRCFNVGDRVRVFEGTHAGVRGYKAIVYEGIIASFARDDYYKVRTVISQKRRCASFLLMIFSHLPALPTSMMQSQINEPQF